MHSFFHMKIDKWEVCVFVSCNILLIARLTILSSIFFPFLFFWMLFHFLWNWKPRAFTQLHNEIEMNVHHCEDVPKKIGIDWRKKVKNIHEKGNKWRGKAVKSVPSKEMRSAILRILRNECWTKFNGENNTYYGRKPYELKWFRCNSKLRHKQLNIHWRLGSKQTTKRPTQMCIKNSPHFVLIQLLFQLARSFDWWSHALTHNWPHLIFMRKFSAEPNACYLHCMYCTTTWRNKCSD